MMRLIYKTFVVNQVNLTISFANLKLVILVPPRKVLDHIDSREDSNVSLTPQRRSFHGGCHVASKEKPSTSYSRSLSTSSSKLSGMYYFSNFLLRI